jgi:hypothetical protein
MKTNLTILCVAWALLSCVSGETKASPVSVTYTGPVSVTYYSGFSENPGVGISFSSPFATDSISGISEFRDVGGSDTSAIWPSASLSFGADFTANISVSTTGTYSFGFGTDDAGYLLIGGTLIASQPGAHSWPGNIPYLAFLTAGVHSLEVQYDNILCCGAVVSLVLPTPLPASWIMMLTGLVGFGLAAYRRRRTDALAFDQRI